MENEKQIIQGIWVGDELSLMEQLSIRSFLSNGHEYHLYVYQDVKNIPEGTVIKDGNEILSKDMIYTYMNDAAAGSLSAFSNNFRFELLYKRGGYYVDTDVICLKKFDFDDEIIIPMQVRPRKPNNGGPDGSAVITSFVLKFPKGSEVMRYAADRCHRLRKDVIEGKISWGLGPSTVEDFTRKYDLHDKTKPPSTFSPFHFEEILDRMLLPCNVDLLDLRRKSYGIHLFHEIWRREKIDKNKRYDPRSLYEQFKLLYDASSPTVPQ